MTIDPFIGFYLAAGVLLGALALRTRHPRSQSDLILNVDARGLAVPITWRGVFAWTPRALRFGCAALLFATLLRPTQWNAVQPVDQFGVAITLVIDRSGSMRQDDYRRGKERIQRLQAVADAAAEFVIDGLNLGANDLIGLVSFARYVDRNCVLTLDHEQVIAALERLTTAQDFREDGTAIGDGLGLALADLQAVDEPSGERSEPPEVRSDTRDVRKVVVLLTDGQQNAGELSIETAFALAKRNEVVVYVIGLEPGNLVSAAANARVRKERETLKTLAESTGGTFFTAEDTETLRSVYREIQALERVFVGQQYQNIAKHLAVEDASFVGKRFPPLMRLAALLLALDIVIRRSIFLGPALPRLRSEKDA